MHSRPSCESREDTHERLGEKTHRRGESGGERGDSVRHELSLRFQPQLLTAMCNKQLGRLGLWLRRERFRERAWTKLKLWLNETLREEHVAEDQ